MSLCSDVRVKIQLHTDLSLPNPTTTQFLDSEPLVSKKFIFEKFFTCANIHCHIFKNFYYPTALKAYYNTYGVWIGGQVVGGKMFVRAVSRKHWLGDVGVQHHGVTLI